MRSFHYKLMVCGQPSWRVIREALPELAYTPGMTRGFLLDKDNTVNRVAGRYIYTRVGKTVTLDKDSLQPKETPLETLEDCKFELDQQKGLACVHTRRGDLWALFEAIDTIPDASIELLDLNLNLKALLFDVMRGYKKNRVKTIRIRDYLARENMLSNSTFKLLEAQDAEKLVERFKDQLEAVSLALKLPDGPCTLGITRNGTVRASDDTPEDLLRFVKDLLPAHHESEVETVELQNPENLAKKAARELVSAVRKFGGSMTISSGGKSTTIK